MAYVDLRPSQRLNLYPAPHPSCGDAQHNYDEGSSMSDVAVVHEVWMNLWNGKPEKVTVLTMLKPEQEVPLWQMSKGIQIISNP